MATSSYILPKFFYNHCVHTGAQTIATQSRGQVEASTYFERSF